MPKGCQRAENGPFVIRLSTLVFEHRYGSRYVRRVDRTVLGLLLIVLIPVLESSRIRPSLIDTAFWPILLKNELTWLKFS